MKFKLTLIFSTIPAFSSLASGVAGILPEEEVRAVRVANPTPLHTFASPVSLLVYDPAFDIQYRNFPEAQSDITLRGSTFDQVGFRIGPLALIDPQTGHYASELPVGPRFLTQPTLLSGPDQAARATFRTVGTVSYNWVPVQPKASIEAGWGEFGLNRQNLYFGIPLSEEAGWYADAEFSRSEANGGIPFSDHRFHRYAGRVQWRTAQGQTDLFWGYQSKFFGLPNLYAAPFNSPEAENLQTTMIALNHSFDGILWVWQAGAVFRRNKDDYDFDRFNPDQGNPFQHETCLTVLGWDGVRQLGQSGALETSTAISFDNITSTSLTNSYQSQTLTSLSAGYLHLWDINETSRWRGRAGLNLQTSNRISDALSPYGSLEKEWEQVENRVFRAGAGFAGTTQAPGYTAIGSPPAGLFGGNPDLGRERAWDLSTWLERRTETTFLRAELFYRYDDNLVDWIFAEDSPNARQARATNVDTWGLLLRGTRAFEQGELTLGYALLRKSADFGEGETPLASFYSLNYPIHRITASASYQPISSIIIRYDQAYRYQARNILRNTSRQAFHGYLTVSYMPSQMEGAAISIGVDNIFNEDYEFLPGTPAAPRQFAITFAYHWR